MGFGGFQIERKIRKIFGFQYFMGFKREMKQMESWVHC